MIEGSNRKNGLLSRMSMRQLLFVCFTLIAIVPVVALSVWVQRSALDREIEAVKEKHLLLAENLTDALSRYARDVEATFGLASYRVMAGTFDPSFIGLLRELSFDHFCIVDGNGTVRNAVIVHENAERMTKPIWDQLAPFWKEASGNRERTLFTPVISAGNGNPRIYLIRALEDDVFAIGAIRTDYHVSLQKRIAFGERGHAAIVDKTGQVIAHPKKDWQQTHKDISKVKPVAAMMRGETGVATFFSPALKDDMIAGYTTEPRTGWGVMIPQPMSELQAAAESDRKAVIGVGIGGLAVAALLSWILAGLISRPIRRVSDAARAAMEHETLRPVHRGDRSSPREVEELTAAYNEMVTMIANRDRRASEADEMLDEAQRLAGIGNWRWNLNKREIWWSDAVYHILGITPDDGPPTVETMGRYVHPDDRKRVADAISTAIDQDGRFLLEHRILSPDGTERHVEQTGEVRFDEATGDAMMIGTIYDFTERKRNEDALFRQANFDKVTGLANRHLLFERINRSIRNAEEKDESFAMLLVDLDGFKTVNELRGNENGDQLLAEVGNRLLELCDFDKVARLGADEFAILVTGDVQSSRIARLAQEILKRLSEPYRMDGQESFIGASIGIALYPTDAGKAADLLQNAETALHRAKRAGRNAWRFFTDKMREDSRLRTGLENDLRRSWERREFDIMYQPIIDLKTGNITAAEALIQWRHPDRGRVATQSIIPIIEDIGLIGVIGRWVLENAAAAARKWRQAGCGQISISVNLSGRQLERGLTVDAIAASLESAGLPPSALILEVTESILVGDMEAAIDWLTELRERGVRVAIDDFGTGYSSLAYLKRLPADAIKIDKEFVRHMLTDERDMAVINSIIALAHGLDLRVAAEGIEEQGQCDELASLDCDFGQGYLFGRPMTAEDFADFARNQSGASVIKLGD